MDSKPVRLHRVRTSIHFVQRTSDTWTNGSLSETPQVRRVQLIILNVPWAKYY